MSYAYPFRKRHRHYMQLIRLGMLMTVVNLMPHPLNILSKDGITQVIPSSGIARIAMTTRQVGCVAGYHLALLETGDVDGLPAPLPGVVYVVSALMAQAVPEREDVVSPNTGPGAARDAEGCIVAVRGFVRFSPHDSRTKRSIKPASMMIR